MKSLAIICVLIVAWIYAIEAMWYEDDLRAHEGETIGKSGASFIDKYNKNYFYINF